jgi:quinol monooxygenase YgiN
VIARIVKTKADPGLGARWAQVTEELLLPAARQQEGYRGYVALYDPIEGTTFAVTLWRDVETERASDRAARLVRDELARAVGAEIEVLRFEVAVAEVVEPDR